MTLSILDINKIKKSMISYLVFSIILLIFGIVYELFSHGIISYFMILSFLYPLILGTLLNFLFYKRIIKKLPTKLSSNLYFSTILSLSIGSITKGILDIYGTTNNLIIIFPIISIVLFILAVLIYVAE